MTDREPLVDEAELVVVGAGPAGCACAARAAELGIDVLLLDKDPFPRDKPCGDGLTRGAVAALERLGLSDLIESSQPIEAARFTFGFGAETIWRYERRQGVPRWARTIPRRVMDAALLSAVVERGGRFRVAHVDGPIGNGRARGVRIRTSDGAARIVARAVIATDGATSRMRRACGLGPLPYFDVQYAVRQYFRCERDLEPLFGIYGPLTIDGFALAGYGWVFPVSERTANVGVGFMRGVGGSGFVSLRDVLRQFAEELRQRRGDEFGGMEPIDRPFGSPVAAHFSPERCERGGVVFAGDAAGTVDPLSGEGIAYALQTGSLAAEAAHRFLCSAVVPDVGLTFARAIPRLGQRISLLARLGIRVADGITTDAAIATAFQDFGRHPLLQAALQLRVVEPTLADTRVVRRIAEVAPDQAAVLGEWNDDLLDECRSELPLATELLYRRLREGIGPALSTLLLSIATSPDGRSPPGLGDAAVALELLRLRELLIHEGDLDTTNLAGRMNASAVALLADLCLARATRRAVAAGPRAAARICAASCSIAASAGADESLEVFYETAACIALELVGPADARASGARAVASALSAADAIDVAQDAPTERAVDVCRDRLAAARAAVGASTGGRSDAATLRALLQVPLDVLATVG